MWPVSRLGPLAIEVERYPQCVVDIDHFLDGKATKGLFEPLLDVDSAQLVGERE